MEPIKLKAALMGLPYWPLGGTILKEKFNKVSDSKTLAQSWELSAHEFGQSVVDSGPDKGLLLNDYIAKHDLSVVGKVQGKYDRFPLLIKFLDAHKNLFIQVHPDDTYGFKFEHEPGKTELWYFFECGEEAHIYYGFNKDVSVDAFLEKLVSGDILDIVNKYKVKNGDAVLIKSGTIHALGAGTFCIEIQQNSNTTYNIWNFGEKPGHRGYHIRKAIDVLDFKKNKTPFLKKHPIIKHDGYLLEEIVDDTYFKVRCIEVQKSVTLSADEQSFDHLLCYEGQGEIKWSKGSFKYQKGDSIYIPAGFKNYTISGLFKGLITQSK